MEVHACMLNSALVLRTIVSSLFFIRHKCENYLCVMKSKLCFKLFVNEFFLKTESKKDKLASNFIGL